MKRLLGIAVLIMALVGLGAPSLSIAAGSAGGHVWTASASEVAAPTLIQTTKCKSLGGKRVLPCHPDQGVIASPAIAAGGTRDVALQQRETLAVASVIPEAELPPPRA